MDVITESKDTAICILDAGLNSNQLDYLKKNVDSVKISRMGY